MKGIPSCKELNHFDKYRRKQIFENILFAEYSVTKQSTITQKFNLNLFWIPSVVVKILGVILCWQNTSVSDKINRKEEMSECHGSCVI